MSAELNAEPPSFDRSKTLTELENHDWGEPHYDSHVVTSSHAYRKVPVAALETEQLRMLVGQSIGLPFLVHVLLEVLGSDPWAEGDFFRGDLMSAALCSQNHLFWLTNPALLDRLLDIVARMEQEQEQDQDVEEFERETFDKFVREAAEGLDYAYHRFFGPELSESWQGRQPKICADLRFEHRVRLPYYDEPAALRTIWERVLFALELDPSVGEFDYQLLTLTLDSDHDLFWLLHPEVFARLNAVVKRAKLEDNLRCHLDQLRSVADRVGKR